MRVWLVILLVSVGVVLVECQSEGKGQRDCPFGIYGAHQPDSCICLNTGLWRVSKEYCSTPLSLIGVSNQSEVCFYNTFDQTIESLEKVLTFERPEVAQLSFSMHKLINRFDNLKDTVSSTKPVYQGRSTLVTFGELKWTLETTKNETFCLVHDGNLLTEFCIFPDLQFADNFLTIQSIRPQCDEMLPRYLSIHSSKCDPVIPKRSCRQALKQLNYTQVQAMQGRALNLSLAKAQAQAQAQKKKAEERLRQTTKSPETTTKLSTTSTTEFYISTEKTTSTSTSSVHLMTDYTSAKISPIFSSSTEKIPQPLTSTIDLLTDFSSAKINTDFSISTEKPREPFTSSIDLLANYSSAEIITDVPISREKTTQPLISPVDLLADYSSAEVNAVPLPLSNNDPSEIETEIPSVASSEGSYTKIQLKILTPYDHVSTDEDREFERNLLKRGSSPSEVSEDESESSTPTSILPLSTSVLEENEDSISPGLDEIGHLLIRDQIDQYVDNVVADLAGLLKVSAGNSTPEGSPQGRYPIIKLLDLMKMIMQRTCSPVKGNYFEVAINTFVKLQLENFHVKEPYMSPSSFRRIEYALKRCYNDASAHVFYDKSSLTVKDDCEYTTSVVTTSELDVYGNGSKVVKLDPTPPSSSGIIMGGGTATREPLIETVWKMVINAHSYCYPYFKAYYNDHQTLTVAFLPLFNNQIQDIWLKTDGYDTTKGRLYGGLLGDTYKVLEDVDNCVAASRYVSQYPWYMSRPMRDSLNKWRRRRRSAGQNHRLPPMFLNNNENQLCMFDPDDPVAFLDKQVCN